MRMSNPGRRYFFTYEGGGASASVAPLWIFKGAGPPWPVSEEKLRPRHRGTTADD